VLVSTTQEVKAELDFLKMNSEELTLHFFKDLVAMQEEVNKQGEKELGDLMLSIRYDPAGGAVDVHIIQANKLPVMDRTGEETEGGASSLTLLYGSRRSVNNLLLFRLEQILSLRVVDVAGSCGFYTIRSLVYFHMQKYLKTATGLLDY